MVCNVHDEKFRTRRRIEALRAPHALSIEEAAYNAYKSDPQGTTDRMDLADNSNRRELPWWMLVAIVAIAAGVVLAVLGMTAVKFGK